MSKDEYIKLLYSECRRLNVNTDWVRDEVHRLAADYPLSIEDSLRHLHYALSRATDKTDMLRRICWIHSTIEAALLTDGDFELLLDTLP